MLANAWLLTSDRATVNLWLMVWTSTATVAPATGPGGTTVIVGMAPENDNMTFSALSFPRTEKTLKGSWYGSARPLIDLPKMVDLYLDGKLKVDEMISRYYTLDEINTAYDALAAGEVARSIIRFE